MMSDKTHTKAQETEVNKVKEETRNFMKTREKCRDMDHLTDGKTEGINKLRKSEGIIINLIKTGTGTKS